ncbi:MAG: hypothetical protein PHN57_03695 [Candidatus Omnitrophica bacterium]|nr:hypothetical protein [Candidatus Omnitrophota bacterium]
MKQTPFKKCAGSVFTLLEILLVLVIVSIVARKVFTTYLKKPSLDKNAENFVHEQGINTSSHKAVLESTKEKIRDINKQLEKQNQEMDELK